MWLLGMRGGGHGDPHVGSSPSHPNPCEPSFCIITRGIASHISQGQVNGMVELRTEWS
jgi:hypothetical protein